MRERNAELDEWLARWGYPGLLRHPANQVRDYENDVINMHRFMNIT